MEEYEFKVTCEKTDQKNDYWTAKLVGQDSQELNLSSTGSDKHSAILAVLDMFVCGRN